MFVFVTFGDFYIAFVNVTCILCASTHFWHLTLNVTLILTSETTEKCFILVLFVLRKEALFFYRKQFMLSGLSHGPGKTGYE